MKSLTLSVDEAVKYLKENIKIHDELEISLLFCVNKLNSFI